MRPSRVDAVLRRCASQRGLVTYRQLSALEVTPRELRTLLRLGVLVRAQPEVYRVGGVATDRAAQMWAAVLAVTKGRQDATRTAAVSQASAAELLGTGRIDPPERPEITVVGHRLPLLWDVDVHRTRRLEPCDVQKIDGLPVTTGARTGIDLAARLDRVTRTALLDDLVCGRHTSRSWMHRRAKALCNGRRGVSTLVELTAPGAEGVFNSWLERRASQRMEESGIPQPLWNHELRIDGRRIGVVDSFWPGAGLSVEWDGLRFHSTQAQRRRDQARDREMTIAGQPPLRYTWLDLEEDPVGVMDEIRLALRRRGMRP